MVCINLCYITSTRDYELSQNPQPVFFPQCDRSNLTLVQNNMHDYRSGYFHLYVLDSKLEDKKILN